MDRNARLFLFAVLLSVLLMSTPARADPAPPGLLAGTSNPGMVYVYDGSSWTAISGTLGTAVLDIIEFRGDLYAATMSSYPWSGVGRIWRYGGGTSWTVVDTMDDQVCDLQIWNGDLYAGTAWNGGKLYVYDAGDDEFDYVGAVSYWSGIRAMYPWSVTGDLHLGDIGYDKLGRYDGTNLIYDVNLGGSCIYDFAEFDGKLYAGAYAGRLLYSSTGTGTSWSYFYPRGSQYQKYIWELELFQGKLHLGNASGEVASLDEDHACTVEWTTTYGYSTQMICSMLAQGDTTLYLGTGQEAGYYGSNYTGVARVYAYDGTNTPVEIFNADGDDTDDVDHGGIQCLFLKTRKVRIDIKPGSYPNSVNLKSKGVLPVAILTTSSFDATTVDVDSVEFGDPALTGRSAPVKSSKEDVDDDGDTDLLLFFSVPELVDDGALDAASKKATVTGTYSSLLPFVGTDSVRIVPGSSK